MTVKLAMSLEYQISYIISTGNCGTLPPSIPAKVSIVLLITSLQLVLLVKTSYTSHHIVGHLVSYKVT